MWDNDEYKKAMCEKLKGRNRVFTDEHKKNISISAKKRGISKETRMKQWITRKQNNLFNKKLED